MRYTKPVRFFYSGNRLAGLGLRNHARTLIGKVVNMPMHQERNGQLRFRRFAYPDGTQIVVQKHHGIVNCHIHVPTGKEVLDEYLRGFIIYYDIGRVFPLENNYALGSTPPEEQAPEVSSWPRYRRLSFHSWQPPYSNPDTGEPILDVSGNQGTLFVTNYSPEASETAPDFSPGWPVMLSNDQTDLTKPAVWKLHRFGGAGDNVIYEPNNPCPDWENTVDKDTPFEAQTDYTAEWKSPASHPKKFTLWWKYTPGGDMHRISSKDFDWGDCVYVNGVKFLVPHIIDGSGYRVGGVRSACIQWHEATDTYWLITTQMAENKGANYITPPNRNIQVYARHIDIGTLPPKDFIQGGNFHLPSEVGGTEQEIKAWQDAWFCIDNVYKGIHIPAVGAEEATWSANDDTPWYYWDSYGYKFNQSGTKFAITNWIEYAFATEVNEFNVTITPTTHTFGDRKYYTPSVGYSVAYTDYGRLNRSNVTADGTWKTLESGTITCGIAYVNDVRTAITVTSEVKLTESTHGLEYADVEQRSTISDGTTNYNRYSRRTAVEGGSDPFWTLTTTYLYHEGDNPVHWDLVNNDTVVESATLTHTNFPPSETSTYCIYSSTIKIGGVTVSTDSGNWTRTTDGTYNDPPEGVPPYHCYGVNRLDLEGDSTIYPNWCWGIEAANELDIDVAGDHYAWWVYCCQPTMALSVHRGDPDGRYIATWVPRSVNARDQGFYYVEPVDSDINPWAWYTEQKAGISDGNPYELIKVYTDVHSYPTSVKPIIRAHFFGTKPLRSRIRK